LLKLRSTYDERPIYQTSYEERKAFLRYDLHAKSYDTIRDAILTCARKPT